MRLMGIAAAAVLWAGVAGAQAPGALRATEDGRLVLLSAPVEATAATRAPIGAGATAAVEDGSTDAVDDRITPALIPPAAEPAGTWRERVAPELSDRIVPGAMDPRVRLAAVIDISEQTMTVTLGGEVAHVWPVSTGRDGHWTPTGSFSPFWLSEHHRSSLYDDAPMPYSVFFNGNIAVHGTTYVSRLGQRASHGCIRVETANARTFFEMVEIRNYRDVSIRVVR